MAKFEVDGLDEFIRSLESANLFDDETKQEMLFTAGDIFVDEVKTQMSKSHFRLGDLAKRITFQRKVKTNKYGDPFVRVTANGKNGKGRSNAAILFVLNYGRDKAFGQITGGYFWTVAKEKAKEKISKALQEIANKKLKERGLI